MSSSSSRSKHEQTKPRDQTKKDKSSSHALESYMAREESSLLSSMESVYGVLGIEGDVESFTGMIKLDDCRGSPKHRGYYRGESLPLSTMERAYGVFGREDDVKKITKMMQSDDCRGRHVSFIGVIGASGLGKTTLVSLVYRENWVSGYFETKGWVFLSAERCNHMGLLLRAIIECFTDVSCGELTDLDQLREILEEELTGKRFLLVLDDACNEDPNFWNDLLPTLSTGAKGSVVVVTAHTEMVANFERLKHSYELNLLEDGICWRIIKSKILRRRKFRDFSPKLERIGKMIAANCEGVPLFAKVVGETICRGAVASTEWWDAVLQSELSNRSKQEINMLPALRTGYNQLPTRLQHCFMYCSLFPKGYIFEEDYLIRLWMSQGFIDPESTRDTARKYFRHWCNISQGFIDPESTREEEDTARKYFRRLRDMSFFQHSSLHYAEEGKFVMHELLTGLARSVSGDAFFRADDYRSSNGLPRDISHLSFAPTVYNPVVQFEPFKELTGLNSLLVIDSSPLRLAERLFYVDNLASLDDLLSKSRCLRTLDLSNTSIKELPDSIEYLENLRYLSLNNTNIRKLPDSIGRLFTLQRLELRNCCYLCELPIGIKDLVNLRHLDVWKESGVICTPLGIGKLTKLQTLGTFNVGELCKISELNKLDNIRGHLRIGCLENVIHGIDAVSSLLKEKLYLKKLTLQWNRKGEELEDNERIATAGEVLKNLYPHQNLQELIIRDYYGLKFPTWLAYSSFHGLASITLINCYGCDKLPKLGKLPSLRYLFLQNLNGLRHVVSDLGGNAVKNFSSLISLKLWEMYELEDWDNVKEMDFPYLESLSISRCPSLRSLPSFESLVELSVHCCGQFPLPALQSLRTLTFDGLQNLTILELPSTLPALETLEIQNCHKLSSLDGLKHLHSLKKLKLRNCPKLNFSQDAQLPDALQVVDIHCSCSSLKNWCPEGFEDISGANNQVCRKFVRGKLQATRGERDAEDWMNLG